MKFQFKNECKIFVAVGKKNMTTQHYMIMNLNFWLWNPKPLFIPYKFYTVDAVYVNKNRKHYTTCACTQHTIKSSCCFFLLSLFQTLYTLHYCRMRVSLGLPLSFPLSFVPKSAYFSPHLCNHIIIFI